MTTMMTAARAAAARRRDMRSPLRWRVARILSPARRHGSADTSSELGEDRLELLLELALGERAADGVGDLAVLEDDHRRDGQDLVLGRGLLVVVDVELDDRQVLALLCDLLEDWGDDAAGSAPGRPEVDEDGTLGLEDLRLEVRGCEVLQRARHAVSCRGWLALYKV